MPYITPARRLALDSHVSAPTCAGELNYLLTKICLQYMEHVGGLRYAAVNDIVGALTCAAQEFYRRIAAPYEDTKIVENGDVYPGIPHP